MNANEASKIAKAQLEPDSELIKPFLQPVFKQIKEAAHKGLFSVEIGIPYRHDSRCPVQWSPAIEKGVPAALVHLGYKVRVNNRTRIIQGYGGDGCESPYTSWTVSWDNKESVPCLPGAKICNWCHGTGRDTSADGKREIECGLCCGSGRT